MGTRQQLGTVRRRLAALRHRDERVARARVARGLDLPSLPRLPRPAPGHPRRESVWAVTMVRNEADIIGTTVRHLLAQDVDGILVADNGCTDDTRAIL